MRNKNLYDTFYIFKYLFFVFVLFLFFFTYLWQSSHSHLLENKIKRLEKKRENLNQENYQLKVEIANIISGDQSSLYKKTYNFLPSSITKKIVKIQIKSN